MSAECPQIVCCLLQWFDLNARDLPWRRTRDPYAIWVSEVMLQQTQAKTVIPYWERWMEALPNLAALAKAQPGKIHKLWEGLGYYTRVRNLQKAARIIQKDYSGRFPQRFDDVLALPGIGRYTAGAICSIAFNQPTPVLDGNVTRVLTRLFGIDGDPRQRQTNARLWELAALLVQIAAGQGRPDQSRSCSHLNQALMELGARVCTPRQPTCDLCPVALHCQAAKHGRVEQLPALGPRQVATPKRFAAFVVQNGSRFLVRQRPAGTLNAYLWEFPNAEVALRRPSLREAARQALGCMPPNLTPFCSIRHTITHYRITLTVLHAQFGTAPPSIAGARWLTPARMRRLPFTGAHKKILQRLG